MDLKKAFITIIALSIIIIFISTLILVITKSNVFKPKQEVEDPLIIVEIITEPATFIVINENGEGMSGTFWIRRHNLTEVYQEYHLSNGYNTVNLPVNKLYNLQVKSEGYYLLGRFFTHPLITPLELTPRKIEDNFQISSNQKLSLNQKTYTLNLKAEDDFKQSHVCIRWSIGILNVKPPKEWFNLEVLGASPPKRFEGFNYDKCYYLGGIYNMTKQIDFTIDFTTFFSNEDTIEFMFYDREKSYDSIEKDFVYRVEDENFQDVGAKDYKFILTT